MALTLGTYDPTEQDLIINGVKIDGYAEGTMIKAARNNDAMTFKPSNSGGGARCRNPDKSGTIEITLHEGSPSNGFLSAMAAADEDLGLGVGEALVKDRSSLGAFCEAQHIWVKKQADFERAKETTDITWILETDELKINHAGLTPTVNTPVPTT